MKKRIALLLAAASLLTLTACGKKDKTEPTMPSETMPLLTEAPVFTEVTEVTETTEAPVTTVPVTEETAPPATEAPAAETVPAETKPAFELDAKFKRVEEMVYATRRVNIRTKPSVQSDKAGELQKDDSVERIGTSSDGWSAVVYKDQLCYIASEYLTTRAPQNGTGSSQSHGKVTETSSSGVVYTTHRVNLRKGPGQDTPSQGMIPQGAKLQRLAICDNGWVKVNYNGTVGYVAGGYLTEKGPEQEETKPAETTDPTETTAPTESAESTETTDSTESTENKETTETTVPAESTEAAETTAPSESEEASQPAESTEAEKK